MEIIRQQTDLEQAFFSDKIITFIQNETSRRLKNIRSDGKGIIVHPTVISNVMTQIYNNTRLGSMYDNATIKRLVDNVIETITIEVISETKDEENKKKLTIWTTVLGDFNKHGLRQYSSIKLNNKNLNKMKFSMSY